MPGTVLASARNIPDYADMDPSNPYDAPRATLENTAAGMDADLLTEPREVSAGQGIEWYTEGWNLVMREPGTWVGVFFLLFASLMVLNFIPFGANVVMPVLIAGLALGCDSQRRGNGFTIEHLFAGFRSPHLGQLLMVGVLTLVATVAVLVVLLPLLFGAVALAGNLADKAGPVAGIGIVVVVVLLIALAVIPLTMATVFAPMLVAFHGMPAFDAMKLSLRGSARNVGAVLVALLMYLVIGLLATLPCLLGWIIAVPVVIAANYVAYRDIFCAR